MDVARSVSPTTNPPASPSRVADGIAASSLVLRAVSPTCTVALSPAITDMTCSRSFREALSATSTEATTVEALVDVTGEHERPTEDGRRLCVAEVVLDAREQLPCLAQPVDGAEGPARPEAHRPGQHEHHAEGPTVAAAAVLAEDGLGHLSGLGAVALLEPRPREQATSPAQAALVADLLEGGRRLAQQPLRLLGPPRVERAPGQVLAGPCHPTVVVESLEAGERLLEQPRGGRVLVAEQGREATQAEHLGLARGVAELGEDRSGLVEGGLRRCPPRLLLLHVGEHEQRSTEVGPALRAGLAALVHRGDGIGSARGRSPAGPPEPGPGR